MRLIIQPPNSKRWFTTSFLLKARLGMCIAASVWTPFSWSPPLQIISGSFQFSGVHHIWDCKLQALVYDILPSTTAVFNYAIGSKKLSANEQFFVGAQTVVRLLQTTQIKQGVSFIAANKVYNSTNKTTVVWIENSLFSSSSLLYPGMDASHVYVRALALGFFYSHISTHTPSTGLRHPSFSHCRI